MKREKKMKESDGGGRRRNATDAPQTGRIDLVARASAVANDRRLRTVPPGWNTHAALTSTGPLSSSFAGTLVFALFFLHTQLAHHLLSLSQSCWSGQKRKVLVAYVRSIPATSTEHAATISHAEGRVAKPAIVVQNAGPSCNSNEHALAYSHQPRYDPPSHFLLRVLALRINETSTILIPAIV